MGFMADFLEKNTRMWRQERACPPMTRMRPGMDGALLLSGCDAPGYAFWRALPFEEGQGPVLEWSQSHGLSLHPAVSEYLAAWRRYEVWFRFERRLFQTRPANLSAPPVRALAEDHFAWSNAPSRPFAVTVAATSDDGEPLILLADAQTAKVTVRHLYTDRDYLKSLLTLDRFLAGQHLEAYP